MYRYRPIYRLSADNWFCRYWKSLSVSVSADMEGHIGSLTDILNCIVRNDIWQESQIFSCVFSDINFCLILFRPKLLFLAFSFHKNLCYTELMSSNLHLKMCKIHKSQNLSYRLSVSVSADMEKFLSVIYRYRPIRKLDLSVTIGIGRYGKSHIDRTLYEIDLFDFTSFSGPGLF